jgi:hypothetical protein
MIYKQDRQYNDQKDRQQSTNRTDNTMAKERQTIQWPKEKEQKGKQ